MEYFIKAYKQYAVFSGRSSRKEYWMFYLFYIIFSLFFSLVDSFLFNSIGVEVGVLSSIFLIVSLIPFIAITTRRLHDINKSGWWQLIILIPIIGRITLLIFTIIKGDESINEYGSNPLQQNYLV